MSDPEMITAMRRELGRQLAALRREARFTQEELASRAGFSRSAVSVAEIGGKGPAREFWVACDRALTTGDVLTIGYTQIIAVQKARQRAAALAAQRAREAQALAALADASEHDDIHSTVSIHACPHCGQDVAVLITLVPAPAGRDCQPPSRPAE
jgi:transcriptional regulator with XRE-family HTH domain